MRLKLWYFINKHAILKKIFFWIFPLLGVNVAKAETIYQCMPCPSGLSSNPGAMGVDACFDPLTKGGSSVIYNGTGNYSGTLQPGWYRVSLKGTTGDTKYISGSGSCAQSRYSGQSGYAGYKSGSGRNCSGGAGGQTYYVFYVSKTASYSHEYNGGSPKLTVTEDGKTRTFAAGKGGNGTGYTSSSSSGCYSGSVKDAYCNTASAGASNQVSGLFSTDKSSSNLDGLGSAGGKLTKL